VNSVIAASSVFLAITLSLGLGIGLGYVAATSLLRAFGHRPQKQEPAALATMEASSVGD